MTKRLTALQVENAKPGTSRREISDGGSGLWLIIQPSGHKSWAIRYRSNGKPQKLTLYGFPSLVDARSLAADALKAIKVGKDPIAEKKKSEVERMVAESNTFASVAAKYLESERVAKLRSIGQIRDRLTRLIFPVIGTVPMRDIDRSHIADVQDHVEKNAGPVQSDRCLSAVRNVILFYAKRDAKFVNPLIPGMARTSPKDRARERILTDDEIRKLWPVADPLAKFILLTGARVGEANSIPWSEIVGDVWTLPGSRHKNKKPVMRPLSAKAMEIIDAQRQLGHERVFGPSRSLCHVKELMDDASRTSGWTWHDLRRTARSLLSRAGVRPDIGELALGHAIVGVRGVYDRHPYHDELAHAFTALAAEIDKIISPPKPRKRKPNLKLVAA